MVYQEIPTNAQNYCTVDSCEKKSYEHQEGVRHWNNDLPEFWNWLDTLKDIKSLSFCKNDYSSSDFISENKPLIGLEQCSEKSNVKLKFKTHKTVIAERVEMNKPGSFKIPAKLCYTILPIINKITGKFENGNFHGKGTIFYHDETKMKVTFHKGVINGLVLIFDKHDDLQVSTKVITDQKHSYSVIMSYESQHSHIFLLDIGSLGDSK